jgi:hypothetical protein
MASVGIFNYHRGIEWQWFNAFFVQGELDCGSAVEGYRRYVQDQVRGVLDDGGIGAWLSCMPCRDSSAPIFRRGAWQP